VVGEAQAATEVEMDIRERVEQYLVRLSITYEKVNSDTWVIRDRDEGLENVLVIAADPVVIIRAKVMDVPAAKREQLYEELLRLNATDLLHGGYALDQKSVILLDTLVAATMDFEEFQSSLDAVGLALSQHYGRLSQYRS
jgi:predicted house-cleaning NTP pyrophosphatase (Maf/HAM1 superfamily)